MRAEEWNKGENAIFVNEYKLLSFPDGCYNTFKVNNIPREVSKVMTERSVCLPCFFLSQSGLQSPSET